MLQMIVILELARAIDTLDTEQYEPSYQRLLARSQDLPCITSIIILRDLFIIIVRTDYRVSKEM